MSSADMANSHSPHAAQMEGRNHYGLWPGSYIYSQSRQLPFWVRPLCVMSLLRWSCLGHHSGVSSSQGWFSFTPLLQHRELLHLSRFIPSSQSYLNITCLHFQCHPICLKVTQQRSSPICTAVLLWPSPPRDSHFHPVPVPTFQLHGPGHHHFYRDT